jgi:hypothetical protein
MPEGMVLVSLRPEGSGPVPGGDELALAEGLPAPSKAGGAKPVEIQALEVKGFIYRDKLGASAQAAPPPAAELPGEAAAVAAPDETARIKTDVIQAFRDALREKPAFNNKTEVVSAPAPGEVAQEFEMRIVLKQPLRP